MTPFFPIFPPFLPSFLPFFLQEPRIRVSDQIRSATPRPYLPPSDPPRPNHKTQHDKTNLYIIQQPGTWNPPYHIAINLQTALRKNCSSYLLEPSLHNSTSNRRYYIYYLCNQSTVGLTYPFHIISYIHTILFFHCMIFILYLSIRHEPAGSPWVIKLVS